VKEQITVGCGGKLGVALDAETSRYFEQLEEVERRTNVVRAREWLVPILSGLGIDRGSKILNVGCGFGTDVLYLRDLGWDSHGVDPGARTEQWDNHGGALLVAPGEKLPFQDKSFAFSMSFEVIEHIGTQPPHYFDPLPNHLQLRQEFATELVRVTRDAILITTPNKWFPLDFWHKAEPWGARVHSPWEEFTVSVRDVKRLFKGFPIFHAPLSGYFRFELSKQYWWRKQLISLARAMVHVGDSSVGRSLRPFAPTLGLLVCLNDEIFRAAQRAF
jgi:SAM-dependent methyltransferase